MTEDVEFFGWGQIRWKYNPPAYLSVSSTRPTYHGFLVDGVHRTNLAKQQDKLDCWWMVLK